jgi:hypothetical protein
MEVIRSSETSVQSTTSTLRHTPEDGILHLLKLLTKISAAGLKIVDPLDMFFQDYETYLYVRSNVDLREDGLK